MIISEDDETRLTIKMTPRYVGAIFATALVGATLLVFIIVAAGAERREGGMSRTPNGGPVLLFLVGVPILVFFDWRRNRKSLTFDSVEKKVTIDGKGTSTYSAHEIERFSLGATSAAGKPASQIVIQLKSGQLIGSGINSSFGGSEIPEVAIAKLGERLKSAELQTKLQDEMSRSLEAFKNRPIHKILTERIIDESADEDLIQVIFDNLSAKLGDYSEEFEIVNSWNKSRQAIYQIWLLEAEVYNGGYNQFYFNSSGQFYPYLPDALRLVGASALADLTQKANVTFENENDVITGEHDGTIEGFMRSYQDNPLCEYDQKFYELAEENNGNLHQQQIDYIRQNARDFVDE